MKLLNKSQIVFSSVLTAAIVIVSLLFHYPIQIVNALTLETMPEFGIHISVSRILFEPFLGLLLFFNRALYPITEFRFVLYWLLAIIIIYSIGKSLGLKNRQQRKSFIFSQLVNLPIIAGLWFTVFVMMIFIPLPNNTIVNNSTNDILVNTHSHTEYSHDGLISQEGLWKWHKRNRFDAFYITEHNNHNQSLKFVAAQRNNEFPGEPFVICGEEFSGSNHLSLLGLKTDFKTKGLTDSMAVAMARADGAAVIVNHWFDGERKSLEYYKNLGSDGFEIENTAEDRTYNREVYKRIKVFCGENDLIMNGGVDFHGYGNACSMWNAFEIPGWKNMDSQRKEEAILNIIKTRDQGKLDVLLYNDRPYYEKKNLFFSPLFTVFNYFRTLNFFQVISWIFWIFLFALVGNSLSKKDEIANKFSWQRIVSVFGLLGAAFMLGLGVVYFSRIKVIVGFTEIYHEYSSLLFIIGSAFLIYAGVVLYFSQLTVGTKSGEWIKEK